MEVKKIGNKTEQIVMKYLQEQKWWCHLFAYTTAGQPCDIVALKDNKSMLIDVKHSNDSLFRLSRIESNQLTCFEYATSLGVANCGFVIDYNDTLYYLPYWYAKYLLKEDQKSVRIGSLGKFENML